MRSIVHVSRFLMTVIVFLALSSPGIASAQAPTPQNVDVSQRAGNESEEAIAVNPTNPNNGHRYSYHRSRFSPPWYLRDRRVRCVDHRFDPMPSLPRRRQSDQAGAE